MQAAVAASREVALCRMPRVALMAASAQTAALAPAAPMAAVRVVTVELAPCSHVCANPCTLQGLLLVGLVSCKAVDGKCTTGSLVDTVLWRAFCHLVGCGLQTMWYCSDSKQSRRVTTDTHATFLQSACIVARTTAHLYPWTCTPMALQYCLVLSGTFC